MGRRKKEELPKEIEVIHTPSNSFCLGCKQTDVRLLKDTLNLVFLTLNMFADYLKIEGDVQKKCKHISKWIREQRAKDEAIKKRVQRKER